MCTIRLSLAALFLCIAVHTTYAQTDNILWQQQVATRTIQRIQFSPNETVAAVFTDTSMFLLQTIDGAVVQTYPNVSHIEFSPDGSHYAFQKQDSLYVVETTTSTVVARVHAIGSILAANIIAFTFDQSGAFLYIGSSDNQGSDYRREYVQLYRWNYAEQRITDSLTTYAHFGSGRPFLYGDNYNYSILAIRFILLPNTSSVAVLLEYSFLFSDFHPPSYNNSGIGNHGEFFVWNRHVQQITKVIPIGTGWSSSLLLSPIDTSIIFSGIQHVSGYSKDDRESEGHSYHENTPFSGRINLRTYEQRSLPYTGRLYSFTPDTNYFAILLSSAEHYLWDFKHNTAIRPVFIGDSLLPRYSIYFLNKTYLLAGIRTPEYAAGIYNLSINRWVRTYKGMSATVLTATKSLEVFATGSSTGTVTLWQLYGRDTLREQPVKAAFSTNDSTTFTVIKPVQFFNHSYPVQFNARFFWDFGDGEQSTEFQPKHLYKNPGTYTVQLVVVNLNEKSDTAKHQIVIPPMSPHIVWRAVIAQSPIQSLDYFYRGDSLAVLADSVAFIPTHQADKKETFSVGSYWHCSYLSGSLFAKVRFSIETGTFTIHVQDVRTGIIVESYTYQDSLLAYYFNKLYSNSSCSSTPLSVSASPDGKLIGIRLDERWDSYPMGWPPRGEEEHLRLSSTIFINRTTSAVLPEATTYYQLTGPYTPLVQNAIAPRRKQGGIAVMSDWSLLVYSQEATLSRIVPNIFSRKIRCSPVDTAFVAVDTGIINLMDDTCLPIDLSKASDYNFSLDGTYIIAVYPRTDTCAAIIEATTGRVVWYYTRHWVASTCLAIAPDGKHFATGAADGSVTVWDIPREYWSAPLTYVPQEQQPNELQESLHTIAFPNPVGNSGCTFRFTLQQPTAVSIIISDMLGHTVATPVSTLLPAGEHNIVWDGHTSAGEALLSGTYIYTLQSNGRLHSHPLIIMPQE